MQRQLELGQQVYGDALEARRALAEVAAVQKQLADREQKLGEQNSALKPILAEAQAGIAKILTTKKEVTPQSGGLEDGYSELASALRVIESGDREVPSQAIAVYKEGSQRVKVGISGWNIFKQEKLPPLNQKLREGNLAPIAISEIEQEVQFLMAR